MKKFLLSLFFLSLFLGVRAQIMESKKLSECSILFGWNKWELSESANADLAKLLTEIKAHPEATISIEGWTDKTGSVLANRDISLLRARSVQNYLQKNGITPEHIHIEGKGVDQLAVDNSEARRADITVTIYIAEQKTEIKRANQPKQEEPKVEPTQPIPVVEEQPAIVEKSVVVEQLLMPRSKFSLRTNLLHWAGGVPNIGVEWMPSRSVGIIVNGGWAPWSSNNWEHNWATWYISPEVRLYLGAQKRWFMGVQFLAGEYNFKPGKTGKQGSIRAGGITGGYKLSLTKCLDMDFSLGLGYGELKYDTYRHADNGTNVFNGKGFKKNGFMPTQVGVSLIWKL